jgi:hypothetical protein
MAREYTTKLLQMIEDGALDRDVVLQAFCDYLSEDDVKDFMATNDFAEIEPEYVDYGDDEPTYDDDADGFDPDED